MKKLIILISLITLSLQGQEGISVSILQDLKLGVGADKEHGHVKPTLDMIINMNWECKQKDYHFFALQLQYERANLRDGYFSRYSINGIWNFNALILPKLQIGFGAGLGIIERPNNPGNGSYSGLIELSYPISKNLSFITKNEWLRRSELKTPKTGYNLSGGLKYKF